jgi:hypothetical protein
VRYEVLTAVSLKTQTGWDRTMRCWVRSPNVAKDHDAFMFRVKQAKKKKLLARLDPEDEDTMIDCLQRQELPAC